MIWVIVGILMMIAGGIGLIKGDEIEQWLRDRAYRRAVKRLEREIDSKTVEAIENFGSRPSKDV